MNKIAVRPLQRHWMERRRVNSCVSFPLRHAGGEEHFAFNSVFANFFFGAASFLSPLLYSTLVGRIHGTDTSAIIVLFNQLVTPERLEEGRHLSGKVGNVYCRYPRKDICSTLVPSSIENAVKISGSTTLCCTEGAGNLQGGVSQRTFQASPACGEAKGLG